MFVVFRQWVLGQKFQTRPSDSIMDRWNFRGEYFVRCSDHDIINCWLRIRRCNTKISRSRTVAPIVSDCKLLLTIARSIAKLSSLSNSTLFSRDLSWLQLSLIDYLLAPFRVHCYFLGEHTNVWDTPSPVLAVEMNSNLLLPMKSVSSSTSC